MFLKDFKSINFPHQLTIIFSAEWFNFNAIFHIWKSLLFINYNMMLVRFDIMNANLGKLNFSGWGQCPDNLTMALIASLWLGRGAEDALYWIEGIVSKWEGIPVALWSINTSWLVSPRLARLNLQDLASRLAVGSWSYMGWEFEKESCSIVCVVVESLCRSMLGELYLLCVLPWRMT